VPDSPQLSLQQILDIDAAEEFSFERAFLQQAGRFGIGQEFSASCADVPMALLSMAPKRRKMIKPCRIESRISRVVSNCQPGFETAICKETSLAQKNRVCSPFFSPSRAYLKIRYNLLSTPKLT